MVNYTCMYMVYAVCKHACVHMCTVHTIYTQPHMCTDRHTHTYTHTKLRSRKQIPQNYLRRGLSPSDDIWSSSVGRSHKQTKTPSENAELPKTD